MPLATFFPIVLMFVAGGLVAVQAPTNSMIAKAGGSPVLAALVSFAVGTAALLAVWLGSGTRPAPTSFAGLPTYAWFGGLYGAVYVAAAAFAAPKIGLAALLTIAIAGQITMALLLDHYGALGLARAPINFGRVAGAVLVVAGVLLVRRS
ncbi:DMT family transporter [Sphingomonas piscis]|uniref:DMT family transporter n=1 Tax=Sphingomonas piscis TaxID=2714943 RepID=A0A6G7YSJ2_9SPHN|nr:DMT family transporter [Sphingomonas piscis]QIK79715.1 DMT family transporter [Sphingomonas piscis]